MGACWYKGFDSDLDQGLTKIYNLNHLEDRPQASVESEFSYKKCCNDEKGLWSQVLNINSEKALLKGLFALNSTKLEPKTCSQRICYNSENLFQSMWISSQVYSDLSTKSDLGKLLTILQFYDPQILPGCDCCEDNGKLMADGHTWISNGKTYGKTI